VKEAEASMAAKGAELGLTSAVFRAVEPGYYDQELEWRRDRLQAASVEELCKSILLENTTLAPGEAEAGRPRCVLVLIQYVAKIHKAKFIKVMQSLEASLGLEPQGKRQYSMRLLEGEECTRLTGFEHNAVTPLGLGFPVVLSDRIAALPSGHFWLGGGHVDLKLRLSVPEAVDKLHAIVADVTA